MRNFVLGVVLCLISAGLSLGQDNILVLQGAKVDPVSGPPLDRGVIILENGKIKAIGGEGSVAIPPKAQVEDVRGKVIIPGLVDTHSHIGIYARPSVPANADGNESSGPVQPAYVKLRGRTIEEMLIPGSLGGLKMANGENPKNYGRRGQAPATRMEEAALARRLFADREDDLATALRIGQEFNLKMMLAQATEGYLARDLIRRAGVPVLLGPAMQRLDALQTYNATLENAALMAESGIPLAFTTGFEGYVPKNRILLFEAAVALANGLGFDRTLRAATVDAARVLGIDDRVGSLQPGKDADLVLFDGDPFEYTTHVEAVVANGEVIFQRSH